MTTTLTSKRVRIAVDVTSFSALLDAITGDVARAWRGKDVQFELALYLGTTLVTDVSNLASITLSIVRSDRTGAPLASVTVAQAAINQALVEANWTDGTQQHAILALTADEMNLSVDAGSTDKAYWLVLSALTTDVSAKEITLGAGIFYIEIDGDDPGAVAGNPLYLTKAESEALFAKQNPAYGSYRVKDGQHVQLYNPDTGKYHTLTLTGPENALLLAAGPGED
jgi:hypothetical protein